LLSLPAIFGNLLEPGLAILSDHWGRPSQVSTRRLFILFGGIIYALSLFLTATSRSYLPLLISFMIFSPANGAFVNLSQTALMDTDPERREQNMARWSFAGSAGVVIGPFALAGAVLLGVGWRGLYLLFSLWTLLLIVPAFRLVHGPAHQNPGEVRFHRALIVGFRDTLDALKRKEVMIWLVLLEFSDLMLDVLLGFLALYFVDVVKVSPQQASLAVGVWSIVGLLGDFLLIPLIERISGLAYLRLSAALELVLYAAFLLVPAWGIKLAILALLGFFNSGWYAILQAQLFNALPGRSGVALVVKNLSGLVAGLLPILLGWIAQEYNLQVAMWVLIAGPVALLVGLRWKGRADSLMRVHEKD
jgi:FSR family fosmidomycin resistance protein-like MFS transporter